MWPFNRLHELERRLHAEMDKRRELEEENMSLRKLGHNLTRMLEAANTRNREQRDAYVASFIKGKYHE